MNALIFNILVSGRLGGGVGVGVSAVNMKSPRSEMVNHMTECVSPVLFAYTHCPCSKRVGGREMDGEREGSQPHALPPLSPSAGWLDGRSAGRSLSG